MDRFCYAIQQLEVKWQRQKARPDPKQASAIRPYEIFLKCFAADALVRCGGDTNQLAPPFISTREELDRLFETLMKAIRETA